MRRALLLIVLFLSSMTGFSSSSVDNLNQRKDVKAFINMMVKKHGFKRAELVSVFNDAKMQPKIIATMERPYEKKNWDAYKKLFLTPTRVTSGVDYWEQNKVALEKAEKKFGVPANVIVAVIGVETLYGQRKGSYRVLDALTTLAFDYPKRSKFFKKELKEYLILCHENHLDPREALGSYAGAMGTPQFMPSSYRHYAVDFSGNGKKDIMNNHEDAIGSVANYLSKHGWKLNDGVAQIAVVGKEKPKKIKFNTRNPSYSLQQLKKSGIIPKTAALNKPKKAGVIALDTDAGKEYWLAYPNFYVITRYNTSPQYALAVYLLSQQIKQHWQLAKQQTPHAYA